MLTRKGKVDPAKKREAVLAVVAGQKSLRGAAKELGITAPTLHETVKKAKEATAKAAAADPAAPPPAPENPALDAALKAAGHVPAVDPNAPIKPAELTVQVDKARKDREDFCVRKVADVKRMYVWAMADKVYKIKGEEEKLAKLKELSPDLEMSIRERTDDGLYEHLQRLFGKGWGALVFVAGMDIYFTTGALQRIAVGQGWKPTPPGQRPPPPSPEPAAPPEPERGRPTVHDMREARERQQELEDRMRNAPHVERPPDGESRAAHAPTVHRS